jgi:hypothetical protein
VSRVTVRAGVAQLLASTTDGEGNPLFKAVYPVMPTRIDQSLTPAAIVMLPKNKRVRRGPMQKHANYVAQARIFWSAPSVEWQTPAAGSALWSAPTGEPQTAFDAWLDQFARELEANKSFPQNTPESGVQTIQIGEPEIDIVLSEPTTAGALVVLTGLVTFPVVEQLLGV